MTKRKTQKERNEQTRAALLEAALQTILLEGVAAIRVVDTAKRAGVTTGAIQHQFGSRENLVLAVLKNIFDLMNDQIVPLVPKDSIRDRMQVVCDHVSQSGTIRLYLILSDVLIGSRSDPTLRAKVSSFVKRQAKTFDKWWLDYVDDLGLPKPEARAIGHAYKASLYGFSIEATYRPNPEAFFRKSMAALTEMMICTLESKSSRNS